MSAIFDIISRGIIDTRSDRMAKYNRLLRTDEDLDEAASYRGVQHFWFSRQADQPQDQVPPPFTTTGAKHDKTHSRPGPGYY